MTKNIDVIVIDDDPLVGGLLVHFLEQKLGKNVVFVQEPKEAMKAIRKFRPEVVLLDWMLSGVSGLDIANKIKRNRYLKNISVFMISSKCSMEEYEEACLVDIDAYLTKPLDLKLLSRKMCMQT